MNDIIHSSVAKVATLTLLPPRMSQELATSEARAVAALAEDRKRTKYTCLEPTYTFTPIPTLFRDCLCQCREEMQHRYWEQLDTDTFFQYFFCFVHIMYLSNKLSV